MSKTDSLLRLLAILRFAIPSKSSRTLNATQAYDVTSSGITLASATGTLLDKDAAVKAYTPKGLDMGVGLNLGFTGPITGGDPADAEKQVAFTPTDGWANAGLSATPSALDPRLSKQPKMNGTFYFSGTASLVGYGALSNKPKATNPNTFFYGAITVGTGDYKKWQGKYAVLKINTVTGKGVLRIYDDA